MNITDESLNHYTGQVKQYVGWAWYMYNLYKSEMSLRSDAYQETEECEIKYVSSLSDLQQVLFRLIVHSINWKAVQTNSVHVSIRARTHLQIGVQHSHRGKTWKIW